MKPKMICIAAGMMILLGACAPSLPVVTETQAQSKGIALKELQDGRTLYANKCSACHGLSQPSSLSQEEWRQAMAKMSGPAKLTPIEEKQILNYLLAFAK